MAEGSVNADFPGDASADPTASETLGESQEEESFDAEGESDSGAAAHTEEPMHSTSGLLPPTKATPSVRPLSAIYGADRARRGELIFTVRFKGASQTATIGHREMKRLYPMDLILFYERFLRFGNPVAMCPYRPAG